MRNFVLEEKLPSRLDNFPHEFISYAFFFGVFVWCFSHSYKLDRLCMLGVIWRHKASAFWLFDIGRWVNGAKCFVFGTDC